MTDRFADGDPGNNDQGRGEYRAGDPQRFNGGDLLGLRQRLDYIRGLGATGVWITPPVANQWMSPDGGSAGYHGYWAEHFTEVDRHLGQLRDLQRLSDGLHRRGMVLVQDIVVNHTGNYFTYRDRWVPGDAARGYEPHDTSPPVARPRQPPFHLNDPRDPAQRARGIYHWTPDITDYSDPAQEHRFQMSGLDDLNTESPEVRRALRASYGHWIRAAGVDAYRVDTAFYVPADYFRDFLDSRDRAAPGIRAVARATGRRDFHVFGEGFAIDRAFDDQGMRKIGSYMQGADGRPLLPGMLNFPLYGSFGEVFARGRPAAELGDRITRMVALHPQIHRMPSFVDNHDVDRFLAGGTEAGLRQALLAMFTLPGIPVVYYGTEQGFTEVRAAMFASGAGSGGRDRYDTSAPLYRDIAALAQLRRQHRLFSRGTPVVLRAEAAGPGALVWMTKHQGRRAVVAFNTAEHPVLLPGLSLPQAAGAQLTGAYGLHGRPADQRVGRDGRLDLVLPARAGQVWWLQPATRPAGGARAAAALQAASAQIDPPAERRADAGAGAGAGVGVGAGAGAGASTGSEPERQVQGDFELTGRADPAWRWSLVVDGDLARAQPVAVDSAGRWRATVDTAAMVDPSVRHHATLWAEGQPAAPVQAFRVARRWQPAADVSDPAGDDHGLDGRLRYPSDAGWAPRQLDIRRVQALTAGGALQLDVEMASLTQVWNPALGFDHVHFTLFIELPGQPGGARVMPLQQCELPEGLRWHRRLRVGGWSNALFEAEGATATAEGRALPVSATVAVDVAKRRVRFTLPAAALGRLPSLSGARLWLTTWDYDGGYRALSAEPQPFAFAGPAQACKVMDATEVFTMH